MTLVEVMVVLGIIGIIVAISVPGFSRYGAQIRLRAATRQIVGLLSLARSLAIGSHEEYAMIVDTERREIRVIQVSSGDAMDQKVRIPTSVSVELEIGGVAATESQIVFRPTGSLHGRTVSIILSQQDKRQTITVTGTTGAISVQ
jgi:Tfp pilus assembly protein FimT